MARLRHPEEVAWAAGLFEGEGSFQLLYQMGHAYARASLISTDRDVVERFLRVIGVGQMYRYPQKNPKHKEQFVWRVTNQSGFDEFADLIEPWLCERRSERLAEVRGNASVQQRVYRQRSTRRG